MWPTDRTTGDSEVTAESYVSLSVPKKTSSRAVLGATAAVVDSDDSTDEESRCSVCFMQMVHPVRLPCNHVFCFLCVKVNSKMLVICPTIFMKWQQFYLYNEYSSQENNVVLMWNFIHSYFNQFFSHHFNNS